MASTPAQHIKILWIATPLIARYGVIGTLAGRAARLDYDRFNVTLAFASTDPDEVRRRFASIPQLKLLHLPELSSMRRLFLPGIRSLVSLMRRERYDIIHTVFVQSDILGAIAAFLSGVPVVLSSVMGYLVVPVGAVRLKTFLYKAAYRLALWNIDRILPITRTTGRQLVDQFGAPPTKIEVLYSGVELQEYPRALRPDGEFVIGSAGQLIPQKGVDTLISAMPEIVKTIPGARLVIAGDGPDRGRLERLACELGVKDRVQFLGFQENMPKLMATFDVFVFSAFPGYDGLPRVILEAMIQHTPVVAAKTDPIEEIVIDGMTGWCYEPGDCRGLTEAIRRIHGAPAEAKKMIDEGFKRSREISENEIRHLEDIYVRSLQNAGDGSQRHR